MVKVEILMQDVSHGKARQYHEDYANLPFYYKIGTFVANTLDPGHMDNMPMVLYHVGIRIDDIVYEFTEGGIEAKFVNQQLIDDGYQLFENCSYDKSQETVDAYIDWMKSLKVQTKYNRDTYDKACNNCVNFLKEGCVVLSIPFPIELQKFLDWLGKHPGLVRFTGVRSGGSMSSSASTSAANK